MGLSQPSPAARTESRFSATLKAMFWRMTFNVRLDSAMISGIFVRSSLRKAMSEVSTATAVPPAPIARPTSAGRHRRGIVDSVPQEGDALAPALPLAHQPELVLGQQTAVDLLDAGLGGDHSRGALVVTGEHHGPDSLSFEAPHRFPGFRAKDITDRDQTCRPAIGGDDQDRVANGLQFRGPALPLRLENHPFGLQPLNASHLDPLAIHLGFHAATGTGTKPGRFEQRNPVRFSRAPYRNTERVLAEPFGACGQAQ